MLKIDWKTCFKIGFSIFLLYLCIHYWTLLSAAFAGVLSAFSPLLIGAGLAFIVNVLMSFYEKHFFPRAKKIFLIRLRRPVCLILAYFSLLLAVSLVFWVVLPQLFSCIRLILGKLPSIIIDAIATMKTWDFVPADLIATLSAIDWTSRFNQLIDILGNGLGDVVTVVISTVTSVFSGVFTGVISIIFSIYLLSSKERLSIQVRRVLNRYLPHNWVIRVLYFFKTLNMSFRGYIIGQTTEAVILGSLVTIGMLILGLPYATMIGALVAVMAFIPIAGAYISGGIGALMLLSDAPINALIFVVFLIILQQIEGNVIYPRVVGSTLGLPGIWVLAAVTVGGGLFGILGMVLAVPLTATVYRLIRNNLNDKTAASVVNEN